MLDFETNPPSIYNNMIALGTTSTVYQKQKLVPFFEERVIPETWVKFAPFIGSQGNIKAGKKNQKLLPVRSFLAAPYICYETAYPDFVAQQAMNSDFLVVISNDAWFYGTIGAHQNFQSVRMRALETGRYLIRGSNIGMSAIIDNRGKVIHQAPLAKQFVLRGDAFPMHGSTPFMLMGSTPIIALCLFILLMAGCVQKGRRFISFCRRRRQY